MSEADRVLIELHTHGAACSRDISDAIGVPVKRVSQYLTRLSREGAIRAHGKQSNGRCRPSVIWWPR